MIEFKGYLSGKTENAFLKKGRNTVIKSFYVGELLVVPMLFYIAKLFHSPSFIFVFIGLFLVFPLLFLIPQSKKEQLATLPKLIHINEEHLISTAERYSDTKSISDVKEVIDHGEYYEITFHFGKLSDKFFCQKSLLSQGTLEEFESLFKGKITKK